MRLARSRDRLLAWLAIAMLFVSGQAPLPAPAQTPAPAPTTIEGGLPAGLESATVPDSSSVTDPLALPKLVLKNGSTFMVVDPSGQMRGGSAQPYGIYLDDTRFINHWIIRVDGKQLQLLKSHISGFYGRFVYGVKSHAAAHDMDIEIERDIVISDGITDRITVTNFSPQKKNVCLSVDFAADFRDMFEVRGWKRERRGVSRNLRAKPETINFTYTGIDGIARSAEIEALSGKGQAGKPGYIFNLPLDPQGAANVELSIKLDGQAEIGGQSHLSYGVRLSQANARYRMWRDRLPAIETDNGTFNQLIERCYLDLYILRQKTPRGDCIAAGLPWYAAAFGRDQIITGLQTLTFIPSLSREALKVLAAYQGKNADDVTEERPGKIMHELRLGEMARAKEIAFRPYYGSVDATPLWVCLFQRYISQTNDVELASGLKGNLDRAIAFLISSIGSDKNGFLTYGGRGALSNQGWKDSANSVMHEDGSLAVPPIALCEVQGYLFDAFEGAASIYRKLGDERQAAEMDKEASALKERFAGRFWNSDKRFPYLAIDGRNRPCAVISSNGAHLLSSSIIDRSRAGQIASMLEKDAMFSGWGIRTLSSEEAAYNPMSYHNGSVWPHDNGMIVSGLCARGEKEFANRVFEALYDVALTQADLRLPELFCGIPRITSKDQGDIALKAATDSPVAYPVSCVPQAWAAGCVFQLIEASLGIEPIAAESKIEINDPVLPKFLKRVRLSGLKLGGHTCNLQFERLSSGECRARVLSKSSNELAVHIKSKATTP